MAILVAAFGTALIALVVTVVAHVQRRRRLQRYLNRLAVVLGVSPRRRGESMADFRMRLRNAAPREVERR